MLQITITRPESRSVATLALNLACPTCEVGPGEPCIDQRLLATGRRMPNATPHAARRALVRRDRVRVSDRRRDRTPTRG